MSPGKKSSYWCMSYSLEHFDQERQSLGFECLGLRQRYESIANEMQPGDRVVYYVKGTGGFGAITRITTRYRRSLHYDSAPRWKGEEHRWPCRVPSQPEIVLRGDRMVSAAELAPRLSFIKNKDKWWLSLWGRPKEIAQEDYKAVEAEMNEARKKEEDSMTDRNQVTQAKEATISSTGETFPLEVSGLKSEIPVYEMNGFRYILATVPVDQCDLDWEAQPRSYDPNQAKRIANSVREKVLMQPALTRYDDKSGKFLITEGQHRWRAFKDFLQLEYIPVIAYLDMERSLALRCGIEANEIDRARGLAGGDFARKVKSTIDEVRMQLEADKQEGEYVAEEEVFRAIGLTSRARIRRWLTAEVAERLRAHPDALIKRFISDRQDKDYPITVRNLQYFLRHLVLTRPDNSERTCRDEELENLVRITNVIVETVLIDGWNPNAQDSRERTLHNHAKNICRRHPFEALGFFAGQIFDDAAGVRLRGADHGPAYIEPHQIDWDQVESRLTNLLNSNVWNEPDVYIQRSIEELTKMISNRIEI